MTKSPSIPLLGLIPYFIAQFSIDERIEGERNEGLLTPEREIQLLNLSNQYHYTQIPITSILTIAGLILTAAAVAAAALCIFAPFSMVPGSASGLIVLFYLAMSAVYGGSALGLGIATCLIAASAWNAIATNNSEIKEIEMLGIDTKQFVFSGAQKVLQGHYVEVRGNGPGMGNWGANPIKSYQGNRFSIPQTSTEFEYKFALVRNDGSGDVIWENGPNRKNTESFNLLKNPVIFIKNEKATLKLT